MEEKVTDFFPQKVYLLTLTFKAPVTTAAYDIHKYFFYCFSQKIRLDVSSESSARQLSYSHISQDIHSLRQTDANSMFVTSHVFNSYSKYWSA